MLIFAYAAYTVYITLVSALLAENRPGRALAIPVAILVFFVLGLSFWVGYTIATIQVEPFEEAPPPTPAVPHEGPAADEPGDATR